MTPNPSAPEPAGLSRRDLLRSSAALAIVPAMPWLPQPARTPEELAAALFSSLTPRQKELVHLPFDHKLRRKVDNNWRITRAHADVLGEDQQGLVRELVRGLHSAEYADRVLKQIHTDNGGDRRRGFGQCSAAFFGDPKTDQFEFVFTGRHVTRRCGGPETAHTAFGGPVFYGHEGQAFREKPDHPGNIYWYQGVRANEVLRSLDGDQRKVAVRRDARPERETATVAFRTRKQDLAGIAVGALRPEQQKLVRGVVDDVLAPFREADRRRTWRMIEAGGLENLHLSYYDNLDIGDDGVLDVWQLESPDVVWYFRGHPHVHVWVHVRAPQKKAPAARRRVI